LKPGWLRDRRDLKVLSPFRSGIVGMEGLDRRLKKGRHKTCPYSIGIMEFKEDY